MYPSKDDTWVEVTGNITKVLCGKSRPIHFRGVTTVVSKLFNIVGPTRAYFGQKDAQQVEVLRRMVKDMFFDLELRIVPIVREESGLARSSRNTYLSAEEKSAAVILSKTLKSALEKFKSGSTRVEDIIGFTRTEIAKEPLANIEYVECYGLPGLYELKEEITAPALLAVAVRFGTTRLIDNIILEK
jgi:pantoate--beta-alanine ligase